MIFRKTRSDEIDEAYGVIEQARVRLAELGIDQWQSGRPDRALVEEDVRAGCGYVVEDSGRIVATAMLSFEGEPSYDEIGCGSWLTQSPSSSPDYLVIHRTAVSDAMLGRGVAKFMLAEAERIAGEGGVRSVRIDTHPGNIPMRSLLGGCGYRECGEIYLDEAFEEPTRERIAYEKLL